MVQKWVVDKIITLDKERRKNGLPKNLPHQDNSLKSFLQMQSIEDLRDLVAIMYTGRDALTAADDADFYTMLGVFQGWDKESCIRKLMEKSGTVWNMGRYLLAGLQPTVEK